MSKNRKNGEEWNRLLNEQERSGETIKSFCERRGISVATFYTKRQHLKKERVEKSAYSEFVPLRVVEGPRYRIEFPQGHALHIEGKVSAEELYHILQTLGVS